MSVALMVGAPAMRSARYSHCVSMAGLSVEGNGEMLPPVSVVNIFRLFASMKCFICVFG